MQHFHNVGYSLHKLSPEELEPIWNEVNEVRSQMNFNGPINNKHVLVKCKRYLENLVGGYIGEFNLAFNYPNSFRVLTESSDLRLHEPWVNFMTKHEFSSPHNHAGVMSFCIWLQIPYTQADELAARPYVPHNINFGGRFVFHYIDTLGAVRMEPIPVFRDWEGVLCLFPAQLTHSVLPFYSSDDVRISVAGNYFFARADRDVVSSIEDAER